jgi:hypothetical protein
MRYKVGAEQLEEIPSLAHRPDGVFRSARTAPVGPTHAVHAATSMVACGYASTGWRCWTKTGRKRSSWRSALTVSPLSSPRAEHGVTYLFRSPL